MLYTWFKSSADVKILVEFTREEFRSAPFWHDDGLLLQIFEGWNRDAEKKYLAPTVVISLFEKVVEIQLKRINYSAKVEKTWTAVWNAMPTFGIQSKSAATELLETSTHMRNKLSNDVFTNIPAIFFVCLSLSISIFTTEPLSEKWYSFRCCYSLVVCAYVRLEMKYLFWRDFHDIHERVFFPELLSSAIPAVHHTCDGTRKEKSKKNKKS